MTMPSQTACQEFSLAPRPASPREILNPQENYLTLAWYAASRSETKIPLILIPVRLAFVIDAFIILTSANETSEKLTRVKFDRLKFTH
jgi:hypothetical protein